MGALFVQVLPLALGAAISPTVFTVAVLVLSSRKKQVVRALLYLAGCWAILLAIGIPGVIFFANLTPARGGGVREARVDLLFAVVLLALGIRRISKRPSAHEKQRDRAGRLSGKPVSVYFVVGLAMMITNFTSLALYFPLLKDLARSPLTISERLAVLVACQVIMLAVVIVPLVIRVVAPSASARILEDLNRFVSKNSRAIMTVVIFVFAAYLLWKGARGF